MATAVMAMSSKSIIACSIRRDGKSRSFQLVKSLRSPASVRLARTTGRFALNATKLDVPEPVEEEEEQVVEDSYEEPKLSWAGVRQLISMGMGTMSGDITEINWHDPARTVVMELEANNLEDEKGNVKKGKYFEDGYVEGDDTPSGPGFFENLGLMFKNKK